MIKAIQTRYKGYHFRSRLEARWAVFFDALNIRWEYEKEGYDLGSVGWYLPDFWLPDTYDRKGTLGVWIEIKAQEPDTKESEKCEELALATEKSVVCLYGTPMTYEELSQNGNTDGYYQWTYYNDSDRDTDGGSSPAGVGWDNNMRLHWCINCDKGKFEFDNDYHQCPSCDRYSSFPYDDALTNAVIAARSARFEHGAQG